MEQTASSTNECVVTLESIVLYDTNSPPRQAYDTLDTVGVGAALTYQRETVGHPLKVEPGNPASSIPAAYKDTTSAGFFCAVIIRTIDRRLQPVTEVTPSATRTGAIRSNE